MIALIIFLWWLSGFVPSILYFKWKFKEVTLRDLMFNVGISLLGPVTAIATIMQIFEDNWDKKIF
jgi:hypothetical protein